MHTIESIVNTRNIVGLNVIINEYFGADWYLANIKAIIRKAKARADAANLSDKAETVLRAKYNRLPNRRSYALKLCLQCSCEIVI